MTKADNAQTPAAAATVRMRATAIQDRRRRRRGTTVVAGSGATRVAAMPACTVSASDAGAEGAAALYTVRAVSPPRGEVSEPWAAAPGASGGGGSPGAATLARARRGASGAGLGGRQQRFSAGRDGSRLPRARHGGGERRRELGRRLVAPRPAPWPAP